MSLTAKQIRDIDPLSVETTQDCDFLLTKLDEVLGDMEGQRLEYLMGDGPVRDGTWLRRLTYAVRCAKAKRAAVQNRRGDIRREDMARAGIVFERVFVEVAKGMLTQDQFTRVMNATKERCHEMQG